ncbi:Protein of uncharacterised function (DUF3256) [Porphyromonas macacae]|uniref:Protein of uncharacterized function (DUF3256) n=1 Tax=Porphyromonas macacae TaxID=28115 RepID=A0A379E743_9PORP|nr:DUF3256 family protein [Porphyromonas macacae]SUB88151.1 Protein of uncharacterised function (DUF3256) [Porphyromonas macacae]
MKRYLYLLLSLIVLLLPANLKAQEKGKDIRYYFLQMPAAHVPMLTNEDRVALLDAFGKDNAPSAVRGALVGNVRLEMLTDTYLCLRTSKVGTLELLLLPLINGTPVISQISTVEQPIPDATIAFFTPEWQPIKQSLIASELSMTDFMPENVNPDTPEGAKLKQLLTPLHVIYKVDPNRNELRAIAKLRCDASLETELVHLIKAMPVVDFYWSRGMWVKKESNR